MMLLFVLNVKDIRRNVNDAQSITKIIILVEYEMWVFLQIYFEVL